MIDAPRCLFGGPKYEWYRSRRDAIEGFRSSPSDVPSCATSARRSSLFFVRSDKREGLACPTVLDVLPTLGMKYLPLRGQRSLKKEYLFMAVAFRVWLAK